MPSDTLTHRMNRPRTISGSGYRSHAAMSRPWAGPSTRKTGHPTDWPCIYVCRWRWVVTKGVIVTDAADAGSAVQPIPSHYLISLNLHQIKDARRPLLPETWH